jgi:hypothetical protein
MIDLFTIDTVGDGVPFGSIESTLSPKFDESYYAPLKVMIFAENCLIERLAGRSHSCVPFNSYIGLLSSKKLTHFALSRISTFYNGCFKPPETTTNPRITAKFKRRFTLFTVVHGVMFFYLRWVFKLFYVLFLGF